MSNEITKDNILEVLEFNKSLGLEVDNIRIWGNCICFNINGYKQEFEFDDDGGTKWLQHTEIETGKLKPLPKANPFDVIKIGQFVQHKESNKWFQRNSLFDYFQRPEEWELTDIRDYNPTEYELKIGDVTTTENMVKINPHNYLIIIGFDYTNQSVLCKYSITNNKLDTPITTFNETGIYIINGKKYDKITIPPFDFAKCLMDAGFTTKGTLRIVNADLYLFLNALKVYVNLNKPDYFHYQGNQWKTTPANAQILIEMAKLSEGLK